MSDIGFAISNLKSGQKLTREKWIFANAGTYVVFKPSHPDGVAVNESTQKALDVPLGTVMRFDPYFLKMTTNGALAHWLPNTEDLLAFDWRVFEDG